MSFLQKLKLLFTSTNKKPSSTPPTRQKAPQQTPSRPRKKTPRDERPPYNKRHANETNHYRKRPERPHTKRPPQKEAPPSGKPFSELGLAPQLVEKLTANQFTHATEVQEKSIPATLTGNNIFCSSETGSGKTLSFLLPMIHKFYTNELHQALIICPTREIAIQIQKTLHTFNDDSLTSALVIGGTNIEVQKQALRQYPKILVATPGRLLDMLNTGLIWLNYTGYVVLDEADRMLDMGFEDDLIKIHSQLSGDHQTILFSATLFPEIKKMAKRYAGNYTEITIGNPTSVASSVEHVVVEMNDAEKLTALKYLISRNPGKMMVFFNTIRDTIAITRQLQRYRGPRVSCIHSKIDQSGREKLINDFRSPHLNILLASDVAARGIDIPNVELVVNFDIPNNSEEYIHRVGRTGRAGKSGMAISFYAKKDDKKLKAVETLIQGKIKRKRSYKGLI